MEVSILLGSIRIERQSHRLAYYLRDQVTERGATVNMIDPKDYPLPLFGSAVSEEGMRNLEEIKGMLKSSKVIIIVTPEYLSNISAALKNVLEYCAFDLVGKVIGIAAASATKFGGLHASNNLLIMMHNLGAHVAPRKLLVPEIHFAFDKDNRPAQHEIREQVEKFLEGVLRT
ncbi:MAG TPA: NAD(P)H-dependent oxidoreductase [Puia sp.]|nr:NAD(P)H-dependent oxidoreductase [Puia sp.]